MKIVFTFIQLLLVFSAFGQTFTASPGTFIPSNSTITSSIAVTGIGVIGCSFGLDQVCINISHTYDADLGVTLTDPSGVIYLLTDNNGGGGDNYSVTCFDMSSVSLVTAGTPPFNGTYRPEGNFSLANNYQDADGTWTLNVTDDAAGDDGTLVSWSLVFADDPECLEPTTADCHGGSTVCSDETFTGNSSGSGSYSELTAANDGCLSGEHQSSWYFFQAASAGTYAFTIETAVDYDFAVWGPYTSLACPPVGPPLRCSYSGTLGNTGLQAGAGDNSEGSGGDAVVNPITAAADDIFVIIVDNYTADGTSFNLNWTLSGGATFDCTLLPVEFLSFDASRQGVTNVLEWKTLSERNNDYYLVEKSTDGQLWEKVAKIKGGGTTSTPTSYSYFDIDQSIGIVYYRLTQVDFDGKSELLDEVSVDQGQGKEVVKIINLLGVEIDEETPGLKIYIYSDGTSAKIVSE